MPKTRQFIIDGFPFTKERSNNESFALFIGANALCILPHYTVNCRSKLYVASVSSVLIMLIVYG